MQNNKSIANRQSKPDTPAKHRRVSQYAETDQDVNNPDGGVPKPLAPNDPEPAQESWPQKQSRIARENEKAYGAGKPEPHSHD